MAKIVDYCNELTMRCFAQAVELVALRYKIKDIEARLARYHEAFGSVRTVTREHWGL